MFNYRFLTISILCNLHIFSLFYLYLTIPILKQINILTALFSCDRSSILNKTIQSLFLHLYKYEKNIYINFNFIDSGTPNRYSFVDKYLIENYFFMNPNNPEYSYGMFFTYLHGSFVLLLEDDFPFIDKIEQKIIYPNFIEEAVLVLNKLKSVKGIILRKDRLGKVKILNVTSKLGNHIVCILTNPPLNYYYTNGPAIYKVRSLLSVKYFKSEYLMANSFRIRKWYTAFTYRGISCSKRYLFTTQCQGLSTHLGYKSTQGGKHNICITSLY